MKNNKITFVEFKAMFLDLEDLELAQVHQFSASQRTDKNKYDGL